MNVPDGLRTFVQTGHANCPMLCSARNHEKNAETDRVHPVRQHNLTAPYRRHVTGWGGGNVGSALVDLIPLILGAVLAPLWVVIVLLMLSKPGGVSRAGAFVTGTTLMRLLQGVVFGLLLSSAPAAEGDDGGKSPVVSTLLLVVGILLLVAAFRKWSKDVDPDEPSPKWMESLEQVGPVKALGLGMLLVAIGPKLWVFTLSAIAIITDAEIGRASSIAAYLIYVVLAQVLMIAAIAAYAVAPGPAGAILQRVMGWLNRYNRPISIGASLIFGLYFTWDGAKSLIG